MAMSLDGFVARENHDLDWLMKQKTGGEDLGYDTFEAGIDGIVMGSGSFLNVLRLGEWPYKKPVVVMSQSLRDDAVPENIQSKVRIARGGPKALMASLESDGWKRVYVDGGLLVQSFIREGLISDLIITVIPILIGTGHRLFGALERDIDLELTGSRSFKCGFVQNSYRLL
ncbi:dihydrofolate reductase family protein [Kiloniella laminariae]|uniref:dihydrofolate reductase family protein n=1 Tax=Kiloniella laminariae TaxID=454162 RepID=UPI001B7FA0EB|nr:dihydrofolate reductase family protein [Kiloniella laminariae]